MATQPETVRMVIDEKQLKTIDSALDAGDTASANKALGGWATKDPVNTLSDVRNNLGISSEFKDQAAGKLFVIEIQVKPGVGLREGSVGPMWDAKAGVNLPGGGTQLQFMETTPFTRPDLFKIDLTKLKEIK